MTHEHTRHVRTKKRAPFSAMGLHISLLKNAELKPCFSKTNCSNLCLSLAPADMLSKKRATVWAWFGQTRFIAG